MTTRKFWPLDLDPEGQIYDNVAWDLPGFRRRRLSVKKITRPAGANHHSPGGLSGGVPRGVTGA